MDTACKRRTAADRCSDFSRKKKKKRDFTEDLRSCETSGGEGALLYCLTAAGGWLRSHVALVMHSPARAMPRWGLLG